MVLHKDDVPILNMSTSDRTKLSQAISKYSGNLEMAQSRQKAAELSLNDKKVRTQKMLTLARQAQKVAAAAAAALRKKRSMQSQASRGSVRLSETAEAERAATRVADVIAVLHKTAEGRREELNRKRGSSASSTWVQALPRLSVRSHVGECVFDLGLVVLTRSCLPLSLRSGRTEERPVAQDASANAPNRLAAKHGFRSG